MAEVYHESKRGYSMSLIKYRQYACTSQQNPDDLRPVGWRINLLAPSSPLNNLDHF
ncbi:MAG: hypothetical protein ABI234_20145 [Ktedonobacteraceae bacterium]